MEKIKKSKKQDKPQEEWEKKAEEYLTGWKRCRADWKNFLDKQEERNRELRVRTRGEMSLEIISVLDNFDLALNHLPDDPKAKNWAEGVRQIKKQLENVLEQFEIREMELKAGDKFNPHFHECVEGLKDKKVKKPVVEEVVKKGYLINSHLLRPALVKVKNS